MGIECCNKSVLTSLITQIQQYEWTHNNGKVKFNAILTTYDILLKDKVLNVNLEKDIEWYMFC